MSRRPDAPPVIRVHPAGASRQARRPSPWLATAGVVAVVAAVAVARRTQVLVLVALFAVVVPFEKAWPRHPQRLRRPGLATDLAYGMLQPLLRLATLVAAVVVGAASLVWIPGLLLRPLVATLPYPVKVGVGVVAFDLAAYWVHRWNHQVPWLWRFHAVHHSSTRLDWISGIRNHPLDGVLIGPPALLLVAAGFSARVTGALAVVEVLVGVFLHANVRWRLRPLQRLVATPEFHHWHHANEPHALDTNFAALLPVWDLLFGTYRVPADARPSVYGTDRAVPATLLGQLRDPLRNGRSRRDVVRHPRAALRRLARDLRRGLRQVARASRRPRPGGAAP